MERVGGGRLRMKEARRERWKRGEARGEGREKKRESCMFKQRWVCKLHLGCRYSVLLAPLLSPRYLSLLFLDPLRASSLWFYLPFADVTHREGYIRPNVSCCQVYKVNLLLIILFLQPLSFCASSFPRCSSFCRAVRSFYFRRRCAIGRSLLRTERNRGERCAVFFYFIFTSKPMGIKLKWSCLPDVCIYVVTSRNVFIAFFSIFHYFSEWLRPSKGWKFGTSKDGRRSYSDNDENKVNYIFYVVRCI